MGMFDQLRGGINVSADRMRSWAGQDLREQGGNNDRSGGNNTGNNNNSNNSGGNNNQNTGGENNPVTRADTRNDTGNDANDLRDLWNNKKPTTENNQGGGNNQGNNPGSQQNNVPARTSQEQVSDYLKSVGLEPMELSEQDLEGFKNDPKALLSKINERIVRGHVEALKGANKLIETQVASAVDKAFEKSKGFVEGKELQGLLRAKYSWAADPAIAPVAETVMQRFLDKGQTRTEALESTGKWFNHVGKVQDPEFAPNGNTGDSFRRSPQQPEEDTNWLKVLTG